MKISSCFGFDEIFGDRDLIVEVGFGSVRWNWVFPGIGILQIQDHGGGGFCCRRNLDINLFFLQIKATVVFIRF